MAKDFVIGVDLGGTNVRAAVVDRHGRIVGEDRRSSCAMDGKEVTLEQVVDAVKSAIGSSPFDIDAIGALGMGIPGTVDNDKGIVTWSPNFRDWDYVEISKPLKEKLGIPISIGNDANVAAFGEYTFGAGVGSKCMVMFTLGTGIGSGLIIDNKIWTGVNNTGPEMGHQIILPDGPRCGCGRSGCLESLAGRDPICFRAAAKAHMGRSTMLLEMSDHDLRYITPAMISEAASKGDEIAIETLNEVGFYLGIGISNILNIINPDKFVIGGGVSQAGDLIFEPIRRTVEVNAIYSALKACEIVPAKLGDDAGLLGGAAMALQTLG